VLTNKYAAENSGGIAKASIYDKMTMEQLAGHFNNPLLVRALLASFPKDYSSMAFDKEKYDAEKKKLERDAIAVLVKRFPETEGKIEVADVVTPMTYKRYCNAWRGAWMTWVKGGKDVPR